MFEFIVGKVEDIIYLLERDSRSFNNKYTHIQAMQIIGALYVNVSNQYDVLQRYLDGGVVSDLEPATCWYKQQLNPGTWFYLQKAPIDK